MDKKKYGLIVSWTAVIAIWSLCSTSCIKKEYNFDKPIDSTIVVGGDSLSIPLGTTDTMFAKTLLGDIGDNDFLSVLEDGSYAITQGSSMNMDVPNIDVNEVSIPSFGGDTIVNLTFGATTKNANPKAGSIVPPKYIAPVHENVKVDFSLDNLGEEILRVDSLILKNSSIEFKFTLGGFIAQNPDAVDIEADLWLSFPKKIGLKNNEYLAPDGSMHIKKAFENGEISISIPIKYLDMTGIEIENGSIEIKDKINCSGELLLQVKDTNIITPSTDLSCSFTMDYSMNGVDPDYFYGLVDPNIEKQYSSVVIDNIPELLKDPESFFDFDNPHLSLDIESNVGIALKAKLKILPYLGGSVLNEAVQNIDILIGANYTGVMQISKFWVAENSQEMPPSYTLVQAQISELLNRIPDSLQLEVEVVTDVSSPHFYDFGQAYSGSVNYDLVVPMRFGPDLHIELGDTLSNIPDILSTILNGNQIILSGSAYNTLPLDLNLKLNALDSLGQIIPIESTVQQISSGTAQGGEVMSELNISLSDRTSLLKDRKISSLFLSFEGETGAETVGVSIYEKSYVRAILKAKVPGGITINLEDLR